MSVYRDLILSDLPDEYWPLDKGNDIESMSDDFTGTDGDPPDPDRWKFYSSGGTGVAEISSNALTISMDNDNGVTQVHGIIGRYLMNGDFDVQLDFANSVFTGTGTKYFVMLVGFSQQATYAESYVAIAQTAAGTRVYAASADGTESQTTTSDTSGKLRMQRVGSTITCSRWNGSGWTTIDTGTGSTTPGFLVIRAQCNADGDATSSADIDNLLHTGDFSRRLAESTEGGLMQWYGDPSLGRLRIAGKEGACPVFDGAGQRAETNSVDWHIADTQGSIECWFESESAQELALFASADAASNSFFCYFHVRSTGAIAWRIQTNVDNTAIVTTATGFKDGKPHHVVVSSNGSAITIYVDGVSQALTVENGVNDGKWLDHCANRDNLTIGALTYNAGTVVPMDGKISDLAYYSAPLTAAQVAEHYQCGINTGITYDEVVLDDLPLSYWRLGEEPEGILKRTSIDDTLNYPDGLTTFEADPQLWYDGPYVFGSPTSATSVFDGGKLLQTLEYANGGGTQYVFDFGNYWIEGDFDVSIEFSDLTYTQYGYWRLSLGGAGQIGCNRFTSDRWFSNLDGLSGQWYTGRANANGALRLTRVGTTVTSYTKDGAGSWVQRQQYASANTNPVTLSFETGLEAGYVAQTLTIKWFNFVCTGQRVYRRSSFPGRDEMAATALTLFNLENAGNDTRAPGLLEADKDESTDFTAASSQALHGAIPAAIEVQTISLECWFQTVQTITGYLIAICPQGFGADGRGALLRHLSNGSIGFSLGDASGTFNDVDYAGSVNDGNPHHAVGTWDGTTQRLYLDGVEVASDATWGSSISWVDGLAGPTDGRMYLCAYRDNTAGTDPNQGFLDGQLDEAAIYARVLTPAEVLEHYERGAAMLLDLGQADVDSTALAPAFWRDPEIHYPDIIKSDSPEHYFRMGEYIFDETPYAMTDDFSDPLGIGRVDPHKWADLNATGPVTGGYAVTSGLTAPGQQLRLAHLLQGDFSVIIQWEILAGWDVVGDSGTFMVRNVDDSGEFRYIYREYNGQRITGSDGTTYNYTTVNWPDGFFKLERIGTGAGAIKLYYKRLIGDSWIQRSSFTDFTLNADAYFNAYASGCSFKVLDVDITADSAIPFKSWLNLKDEMYNGRIRDALSDQATALIASEDGAASCVAANLDYFEAQDHATIAQAGTGNWTFECWFKIDALTTNKYIFNAGTRGTASEPGVSINIATGNAIGFILDDGTTQISTSGNTTTVAVGEVHHLVCVIDRDNDVAKVYQDGVQVSDSTDITGLGSVTTTLLDSIFIGAGKFTTAIANYFDGDLDEVAIYASALSESRIKEHYRAGLAFLQLLDGAAADVSITKFEAKGYSAPSYKGVIADQGAYFHWSMDDLANPPTDEIGSRDATVSGSVSPAASGLLISEPLGHGLAISAGALYYNSSFSNPQEFAISMVVMTTVSGGTLAEFNVSVGGASHDRNVYIDTSGKVRYYWWTGSQNSIVGTTTVSDGYPHHIAVIQSGGTVTLFVDGEVEATASATPNNHTGIFIFGQGASTPALPFEGANQLIGMMDEIALWITTLPTAADIGEQYAASRANDLYGMTVHKKTPGAFTRLDEKEDPHLASVTGQILFNKPHGSTTFAEEGGKTVTQVASALHFTYAWFQGMTSGYTNGTSQYIHMADSADWDVGANPFTVEITVLPFAIGSFDPLVAHCDDTVNGWFIDIHTSGAVRFVAMLGGTWGVWLQSSRLLADHQWAQIAVSRDENAIRLFIDGVLEDELVTAAAITNSNEIFQIGHLQIDAGTHRYASCYYDNFRFTQGVGRYRDHYIPLARGEKHPTANAYDSKIWNWDVTVGSGITRDYPRIPIGSLGRSYYFDGTNDAESRIDMEYNDNFTSFTVELWIRPDADYDANGVLVSKSSYFATAVDDFPIALTMNAAGLVSAAFADNVDYNYNLVLQGSATLGAINHIAVKWANNDHAELWINGVKVDDDQAVAFALTTNSRNWCLGSDPFTQSGGANTRYLTKCRIDEFALYERSLTDAEIEENYAAGINAAAIPDLAVTLDEAPGEGLALAPAITQGALTATLVEAVAEGITNEITVDVPIELPVTLDAATAEGVTSDVTVPNPGIAVGLQNAKGEATILKVNVIQGAVSAALLAARAEGTAFMPPAINSAVTVTLPRAEALPGVDLPLVTLSGLISNIGAAISQSEVVPPIALVGGELAVIGAAQANGQAVNPSTLLAGLIATLTEAMADTSGVDMIGVASAITVSLTQATAEQIAKGLLTQLGGAAVTLPATAGEALSSDVAVTIDFAAINIGAIDALAETNGPNISLGDFQVGLDAAVALGFTPEVTVTVDFGAGEIEKESLVYRFQLQDVVYKVTYASAVALKNKASMVVRKDEESDVKMATYGDDVYQSTQDNEV